MTDKPIFELPDIGKGSPFLGMALVAGPGVKDPDKGSNLFIKLNFTGPPGACSGLYYALVFQLGKWNYNVVKVDEWINVSPEHAQYYQMIMGQKQALEGTIKAGLQSAAEAVANYDMLSHDLRKLKEILNYYKDEDDHSLKAMFIDQVDVHTDIPNTPIALRSIVSRWPTIIHDFIRVQKEEDIDPKKLGVSQSECVILKTKLKLYNQWKDMFRQTVIDRYDSLKGLVESRKKTIEEYRKWLKPYIARFKMMRLGGERTEVMKEAYKSFVDLTGQATFGNSIKLWAWRPFKVPEIRKSPVERFGKFVLRPDDNFVRLNFIFSKENGLAKIYPWLLDEKEGKTVGDGMIKDIIEKQWNISNALEPEVLYYVFFEIDVFRAGSKTPSFELEDITFDIKAYILSQNMMLVKFLELKCREHEMERYVDEILGVSEEAVKRDFPELFKPEKEEFKIPDYFAGIRKYLQAPRIIIFPSIAKAGFYERDFADRITAYYIKPAGAMFTEIRDFLKEKMGIE